MAKRARAVSVIGGADGPTTIFLAGKLGKKNPMEKLKQYRYRKRRAKTEAKITANPHTLEEVITYMTDVCGAEKVPETSRIYQEQRQGMRESLILRYKPELLGKEIEKPEKFDEKALKEFLEKINSRSKKAQEIPEDLFPIAFSIYEIKFPGTGKIQFEVEKNWGVFSSSYSGEKKKMKKLEAKIKEIYLYYGVSEEDIRERSERYGELVTIMML